MLTQAEMSFFLFGVQAPHEFTDKTLALPTAAVGAFIGAYFGSILRKKITIRSVQIIVWVTRKEKFDNPLVRQKATPEKRAEMQAVADEEMRASWHVRDGGVLFFDGKGYSLATAKDYADFEMWIDWRLLTVRGDSGLYLRGSPQVQIWDAHNQWDIGSGGLFNNKQHPSKALSIADRLIGDWNTFYIKMVGEKVTVKLNGELVVDETVLENYWDRAIPIFQKEQIELQCHGDPIEFKNIYIREI